MSLECDTDKQDQDLMALLICGVWAAESTKVSFAPWNLFAGMCISENQHRPTSNRYVESDQHQWSRNRCRMHLCTLHMRADKELVISCAIISHSLVWAAWTCSHIQLQVYLLSQNSPVLKPVVGYKWKIGVRPCWGVDKFVIVGGLGCC